jgi:hypothetical protein
MMLSASPFASMLAVATSTPPRNPLSKAVKRVSSVPNSAVPPVAAPEVVAYSGAATAYVETAGITLMMAMSPLSSWFNRWQWIT